LDLAWQEGDTSRRGRTMLQPQIVSTESVPAHRRVAFWNELIGGVLIAQVADPVDPRHFAGSIKSLQLGDIRIAEIHGDASRVRRTASHVAQTSEPVWLMRVQLAGSVTAYYDRQEVRLQPGDFMLYDNTQPYEMFFHEPAAMLALRISQNTLLRYIGRPDHFACRVMPGLSGASGLASQFLQAFWQRCPEVHSDVVAKRLMDVALRLVAGAYADASGDQSDQSCLRAAHRLCIYRCKQPSEIDHRAGGRPRNCVCSVGLTVLTPTRTDSRSTELPFDF
jgi:hypothetical protein